MLDLRPYKRKGAKLTDYLPWAGLVANGVVLNKDGAFVRTARFRGPDLDSSAPADLMGAAARLNNGLRRFGSHWCLHVEARRSPAPGYPQAEWPDPLSWLIDEERRQVFEQAGQRFETNYFLTLCWLCPPERQGKLESALFEGAENIKGAVDYAPLLQYFLERTEHFLSLMQAIMPMARWLDDDETLTYLHACISDRPQKISAPNTPFFLDALLADAPLIGGLAPKLGAAHLKIISVRAFVTETEPGLLDALNRLPIAYRWVSRYLPLDRSQGRAEIEKIRRQWLSQRLGLWAMLRAALFKEEPLIQDNAAMNLANDADLALQELDADALCAGYATITITVAEPDLAKAQEAVRQIQEVTDGLGFVTEVETVNAVEAWLGSLPGQAYADVRRPIVLSASLAHLLPTSAVWAGPERNEHLGGPPLMLTATDGATPFRLDLHVADVGHTLMIGPTGAGKSVLLAMLAAQWRRYRNAQIYLFDKGRSSRATILGLGGDFFDLGEPGALGLAPLEAVDDPQERGFALEWLESLIEDAGVKTDPQLRAHLWRTLEVLGARDPQDRNLTLYAALIQDEAVRTALGPFTLAGPYGGLLDHERTSLGYGAVQAFEMDSLLASPRAARAVLGVLFHVLERRFTGAPTLLVLDEAWLFLRQPHFSAQIQEWLKTLRKKNVAVVFASQELADIEQSPIASTLAEACLTRIFLPNDRAREPRGQAFYRAFGLNERQIALIADAIPKQDYYFVSPQGARLFELELGPAALAFVGASTPKDQARIDKVLGQGAEHFAHAWLLALGLKEPATALERFMHAQSAKPPAQDDQSALLVRPNQERPQS